MTPFRRLLLLVLFTIAASGALYGSGAIRLHAQASPEASPQSQLRAVDRDETTERAPINYSIAVLLTASTTVRLFDVSSGFEEGVDGRSDEVDHGREGCGIAVAPGTGSGRLEQAVEAFEAGGAVG